MKTVLEVIQQGTRYLEQREIADARRSMEELVAAQLHLSRLDLYLQFERPLSEEDLVPLRAKLRQRGEGTPLQHLLEVVDFHHRTFRCDQRALIPRPETEELAEHVLRQEFPRPARILDMGCGSGVLGLTVAAELGAEARSLTLADVSPQALDLARENAERVLGAEAGVDLDFVETDLCAEVSADSPFDLIVANLPYVAETERTSLQRELAHDPPEALYSGPLGLDHLNRFIPAAFSYLNAGGLLALEVGHDQGAAVRELLASSGYVNVQILIDLNGVERFPMGWKSS